MAKLLGLSGERAGAPLAEPRVHHAGDPAGNSERKPAPFHRRVASRILRIEQVVIFDEQQAVNDERRNCCEVGVDSLGVAHPVKRVAVTVEQLQSGARLFSVDRVIAQVDKPDEWVGPFRLALDRELMGV